MQIFLRGAGLALFLSGCAQFAPKDINDTVRLVKEAGGSGCLYVRGNSRPYADVSVLSVSVYGSKTNYQDCLNAIPENARSMISPP